MRCFIDDVAEQPEVLQRIASFYAQREGNHLLKQVAALGECEIQRIIFTGMGSSFAAARFAAMYLWSYKVPAIYLEASELLHYGMETLTPNALLILISQSGESIEIKQILNELPSTTKVIGITNEMSSTLAMQTSVVLPLLAGEESTTSSKTYTATLAVMLLVCGSLVRQSLVESLTAITTAARKLSIMQTYTSSLDWSQLAEWLNSAKSIFLIGRGAAVSSVIQGALTLKELVKIQAEGMEAATFRHGPLETVNEETVIFVFTPKGKTYKLVSSFVDELVVFGAKVIVIEQGNVRIANDVERTEVEEDTDSLDEFFTALIDIYPVQIAAHFLAERLERNGDFRWITKVTTKE